VAYDEDLATRVREMVGELRGVREQKMFGGIAFMVGGNMAVGVHGEDLIVRLDPAEHDAALARAGARTFDLSGRPMQGWLLVEPSALSTERRLRAWVDRGTAFAASLPPKASKKR